MSETPKCWCRKCRPITMDDMRFVTCPSCGDKRCVHAENHEAPCAKDNIFAHNSFVERKLTAERERADRNQEDAERLDWMDKSAFTAYRERDPEYGELYDFATVVNEDRKGGRVGEVFKTIREAIDAARRK